MAKAQEFRDQTIEELEATYLDLRKKLFDITNASRSTKKLEKPHEIGQTKKDIARVLTIINEKRRAQKPTEG